MVGAVALAFDRIYKENMNRTKRCAFRLCGRKMTSDLGQDMFLNVILD